ncbi:oligopeptide ABC transporter substrate-binding protein [Lactococcus fujiensis]|uniref:Oligopeptide ABC transporter substrate-binding protein OppA n=1 Tax=Lactococcus fujiensis JCM 16395 TaxID=1291764 RepID=A0A2A5RM94_9LACT|nr:oligopeptide ABC transporter substrate-binding protein [Lactococcus fujiensis]PCS00413.1 oligopeptide ABC transporter substrate-binding protein OppA [Lactococcus fujiensis JCM 16395]
MKKSKVTLLATSLIVATATLSACGNSSTVTPKVLKAGNFDITYDNKSSAINGGQLKVAYESDSPFKAQWLSELDDDATFSTMTSPSGGALFNVNSSFKIQNGGPANISFDKAAKTATITLRKNLKWSDGSEVTAKDYEFQYEVIADPAYGSDRWTSLLSNIVGMDDFHNSKSKTISGITFPDGANGKVIKLQFKENKPGFTQSGNGYFLESADPYNYLKGIAPKDLASSPKTTTNPLVFGLFMPVNIVTGESIKYVPNPYYYGKKPKLSSIIYSTVSTDKAAAALKAGQYDFINGMVSSQYTAVKNLKGYVTLGNQDLFLSLMYFNLGHYDEAKSLNVQDRKTPLQDEAVREALGYARNVAEVDDKFSNGLATPANGMIPPIFSQFTDANAKGYEKQNLAKANQLLEDDGWKLNKSTGYREKDGKTLSFVYAARQGDANQETIDQNYIQQWQKIGVKVTLYNGKLMEFNSWVDKMTTPPGANDWDITDGSWSLSSEPSQQDLFSAAAPYNFGHFNDPEITNDMNNIDSVKADNSAYRKAAFIKYSNDMIKKAYVVPTNFDIAYTPVNKRVTGMSVDYGDNNLWSNIGVSSNSMATK